MRFRTILSDVRWPFAAGVVTAFLTFVIMYLLVNVYVTVLSVLSGGHPDQETIKRFAALMGTWGMPVLYVVLVTIGAGWMVRRAGATVSSGVLLGLISTAVLQLIGWAYGPLDPRELVLYLVLGVLGGALGWAIGRITLAGRDALYRASRDIGAADEVQSIAAAIGEHLAGVGVTQVSIWRLASQLEGDEPPKLDLLGAWSAGTVENEIEDTSMPDASSMRAFVGPRRQSWSVARIEKPPGRKGSGRERRGTRSALLVPLNASGDGPDGLLVVASARRGFSRVAIRSYLTVGAQVSLALENLRLVEQARRSGMMGERRRLAHEIHDTLIQGFASIVMNLEAAEGRIGDDPKLVHKHMDEARRTARESMAEARRMVWALRPEALGDTSLSEAVMRLAEQWREGSGVSASVTITGVPRPLSPQIEATLLRVVQEALNNARKHAGANRVVLTLSYMEDRVALDIQDDGVGFDPDDVPIRSGEEADGIGLKIMRERVEQCSGTLIVESAPGTGTTMVVDLPVSRNERPAENTEVLKGRAP